MKRRSTSSDPAAARLRRLRVAEAAARLLAQGETDPVVARRKAADQLGVRDPRALPDSAEIREALLAHRRLFAQAPADPGPLARQRQAALAAMDHFADFDPRVLGPVLDGSAGPDDAVVLHLHADDPDAVARLFADRDIPARQRQRRLTLAGGEQAQIPCWDVVADGQSFELWVLPASAARQSPRDPLGGATQPRASRSALARLLAEDDSP